MSGEVTLLDEAARAGWLYYVAGMTQDQIATELGVSRQRAQRLVSKAMAEGLVRVRLGHRIGRCLELETDLIRRFGLQQARVAPDLGAGSDPSRASTVARGWAASRISRVSSSAPSVVGTGTVPSQ